MTMLQVQPYRGEDRRYHARHEVRTLGRARAIAGCIREGAKILDVGCNSGLTSRYLLRTFPTAMVTGLELRRDTVDADVLENDRFSLMEGNVCDVEIDDSFDVVVYGAVHHHIVRERGLGEAVKVLRKLASCCRDQLYIETGQLTEGGRWAWQRALRKYFRTDEEHFYYLLRCIEERILGFEIIGKFWIHATRRWLLRIDLSKPSIVGPTRPADHLQRLDLSTASRLIRSFGSDGQKLIEEPECLHDSPTCFYRAEVGKEVYFVKQGIHAPSALDKEYAIGHRLARPWANRPLGRTTDGSIVFAWLTAPSLLNGLPQTAVAKRQLARQLMAIWRDCKSAASGCPPGPLLPSAGQKRIADVVDLNPNNVMIEDGPQHPRLRVVDFEAQSSHYRWRNRCHIAHMLWRMKALRWRAAMMFVAGLLQGTGWMLLYQFVPTERRIRDRQPSMLSWCVASVRGLSGRIAIRLLPRLSEL